MSAEVLRTSENTDSISLVYFIEFLRCEMNVVEWVAVVALSGPWSQAG